MVLKYSWISFWFSLRKLRKLMACFRLDQTPSSRPGTAALIFCTRLEPRAAGLSSDRWLIGFSWGFFPYTRRKHACLPAVSSPHISTHSPHLCVAINGFGYQLGCWFSVIPDYVSKMKIAEVIFVWTICIYIRKPWRQFSVSKNWSIPFMQPLNCSNHQKWLQALTGF